MSTEIRYLTYVTVLTALLWIPYVLNMIRVRGLADAVGYPVNPRPLARWAAAEVRALQRHRESRGFRDACSGRAYGRDQQPCD